MSLLKGRFTISGTGRIIVVENENSGGGNEGSGPVDPSEPEVEPTPPTNGYVNIAASFSSLSVSSIDF